MTTRTDFLTPVGRLVQGDPFKGNTTDAKGNPMTTKTGPNKGQPRTEYYVAIAIAKNDPGVDALIATIKGAAAADMPGSVGLPHFAFKYEDGDSTVPNKKNKRPCDREGWPGNWIFKLSTGFSPKCYTAGGASVLTDPTSIKRGYYVRVSGSVRGNGDAENPGVYLNLSMVEFIAFGEELTSGPDGAQVFGSAPAAVLPAGASATPIAPTTTPAPAPGPGAPAPSPTASEPAVYNVNGREFTREALVVAGWTDAQIDSLDPPF